MPSKAEIEAAVIAGTKEWNRLAVSACTPEQVIVATIQAALTAAEKVRKDPYGAEAKDEARTQPETGQPIPEEAVEAGARNLRGRYAGESYDEVVVVEDDRRKAEIVLTAALPHLEAAIRAKIRARVEALRLTDEAGLRRGLTKLEKDDFNFAVDEALAAIDREDGDE